MKRFAICGVLVVSAYAFARPNESATTYQDIQKTLGFVPAFVKAFPEDAITGAWDEMKAIQISPTTALPIQIKQLIGLAVAAQIPCRYCVYFHTQLAKAAGATDDMVKEAIAVAAFDRHWSTVLNGMQIDLGQFKLEVDKMFRYAAQHQAPIYAAAQVTDATSAYVDMQRIFGIVPTFLHKFPEDGIAAAWREMKDVQLDPKTALPPKTKDLIGLAVAAQVPCSYCIYFDTEAALHDGATDAEIAEAVALAAITRQWSTVLNGSLLDEPAFRRDVDRMVKNAKNAETTNKTAARP